ncbi:MAG: ferritin-like domain-containing protein [Polyangiales bacterium]
MASVGYHESEALLSDATKDMHRAIVSLMEELEAIDWYQQRADVTTDAELKAVLIHNKNEEIEHAMMGLEWIRRHSPEFDANCRTYLFTQGPITEIEEKETGGEGPASGAGAKGKGKGEPKDKGKASGPSGNAAAGLGLGSLRKKL